MSPSSTQSSDLFYTRQEILDYLPGGWALSDPADAGGWSSKRRRWEVSVRDIADVEWALEIEAKRVESDGRIEALKLAIDKLYRAALGKSGFFG
jgi:hypothetical protein